MSEKAPSPISDYSHFELRQPESGEPFVVATNETGSKQRLMTDAEILSFYGHDPTMSDWKNHIQEHVTRGGTGEEPIPEAGATESINLKERRDEMPYPAAPHAFEATLDVKAPEYPYGAVFTTGGGDDLNEERVTVIGTLGVMADGKSYVRTKEHGVVPAEQVKSMELEVGIDVSRFVLAGIGPALYWKKVNTMAEEADSSPSVFKKLLNKFVESHPGLKAVGETVLTKKEEFSEKHPSLSGVLSVGVSALKSAGSFLVKEPENSGMYNFKDVAERDMQVSRAFYMARPNHPITIWFKSHNYDGTINQERKAELYEMRRMGIALQEEIASRGVFATVFHPSKLYRHELHEIMASIPGSLGHRAVAFANIQRIANDKHRDLTHRQWAISLMNGRSLTLREREDFRRYVHDPETYIRRSVSGYPSTMPTPRTA